MKEIKLHMVEYINLIIMINVLLIILAITASAVNYSIHKVKHDETLDSIAIIYNVPIKDLMTINKIRDKNKIYERQKIKIPILSVNINEQAINISDNSEDNKDTGNQIKTLNNRVIKLLDDSSEYSEMLNKLKKENETIRNTKGNNSLNTLIVIVVFYSLLIGPLMIFIYKRLDIKIRAILNHIKNINIQKVDYDQKDGIYDELNKLQKIIYIIKEENDKFKTSILKEIKDGFSSLSSKISSNQVANKNMMVAPQHSMTTPIPINKQTYNLIIEKAPEPINISNTYLVNSDNGIYYIEEYDGTAKCLPVDLAITKGDNAYEIYINKTQNNIIIDKVAECKKDITGRWLIIRKGKIIKQA